MMDFMHGITGRSCAESNSDSLTKSVEKSNDDLHVFFYAVDCRVRCVLVSSRMV